MRLRLRKKAKDFEHGRVVSAGGVIARSRISPKKAGGARGCCTASIRRSLRSDAVERRRRVVAFITRERRALVTVDASVSHVLLERSLGPWKQSDRIAIANYLQEGYVRIGKGS